MATATKTTQQKIVAIQKELNGRFFERQDATEAMLLAILSKSHLFFLGTPGTAKSELVRALVRRIDNVKYFEALLSRTRPAEAVLGPLNLPEFREKGSYIRRTEGYLPDVQLAFLDEVGNMGPTLGHDLHSILNERLLHEVDEKGRSSRQVPLYTAFTAGNQIPTQESDDAEALWDRISIRVKVDPIRAERNFMNLFNMGDDEVKTTVDWADLANAIDVEVPAVTLPKNVIELIAQLKLKMSKATPSPLNLSDRRWRSMERVLKAAAWLRGDTTVSPVDIKVLRHMVWTEEDQIAQTERFVLSVSDKVTEACKEMLDKIKAMQSSVDERKDKKSDDRAAHAVGCNTKMKEMERDIRKLWVDNPGHAEVKKTWDAWSNTHTSIYKDMMDMERAPARTL